jgi:hypothetical protein
MATRATAKTSRAASGTRPQGPQLPSTFYEISFRQLPLASLRLMTVLLPRARLHFVVSKSAGCHICPTGENS